MFVPPQIKTSPDSERMLDGYFKNAEMGAKIMEPLASVFIMAVLIGGIFMMLLMMIPLAVLGWLVKKKR